jgi:hypothetical protein
MACTGQGQHGLHRRGIGMEIDKQPPLDDALHDRYAHGWIPEMGLVEMNAEPPSDNKSVVIPCHAKRFFT